MTQVDRVNAAWERIETWYKTTDPTFEFPAGATAAEITALETHMGLTLPEELKVSLTRHNGFPRWVKGDLRTIEEIKEEWNAWAEMVDNGDLEDGGEAGDDDFKQPSFFDKKWIPIDHNGAGDGFMIDLNPGPKGKAGQILDFGHEVGAEEVPAYSDYVAYLEEAADLLEAGEFKLESSGCWKNDQ